MKGFLAGVLLTGLIGGFLMHLSSRYDTLGACTAAEKGLSGAVLASLRGDVREALGPDVPRGLGDAMFAPLAEPLIRERVRAYLGERSWFGCGWLVVRLDFLGADALVSELRSLTLRF